MLVFRMTEVGRSIPVRNIEGLVRTSPVTSYLGRWDKNACPISFDNKLISFARYCVYSGLSCYRRRLSWPLSTSFFILRVLFARWFGIIFGIISRKVDRNKIIKNRGC